MKVGIIGLGHAFYKQFEALKSIEDIELVALCDIKEYKLEEFKNNYYITKKYKNLINICDYVLIATPPKTHLKIASFFMIIITQKVNFR